MKLNIYQGIIAALVLIIAGLIGCNRYSAKKYEEKLIECGRIKTVTRVSYYPVTVDLPVMVPEPFGYIPGEIKTSRPGFKPEIPKPQKLDTSFIDKTDTAYLNYLTKIKEDYFSRFFYDQEIPTQYGKVKIKAQTYRNRLDSLQSSLDFLIPETTITNTVQPKVKNELWLGLGVNHLTADSSLYVKTSLMFLVKRRLGLEAEIGLGPKRGLLYGGSVKFLLSTKKR